MLTHPSPDCVVVVCVALPVPPSGAEGEWPHNPLTEPDLRTGIVGLANPKDERCNVYGLPHVIKVCLGGTHDNVDPSGLEIVYIHHP